MFGAFKSKSTQLDLNDLSATISKYCAVDLSSISAAERDYLSNELNGHLKFDIDFVSGVSRGFKLTGNERTAAIWANLIFEVKRVDSLKEAEPELAKGLADFIVSHWKGFNPYFVSQCRSALENADGQTSANGIEISKLRSVMDMY